MESTLTSQLPLKPSHPARTRPHAQSGSRETTQQRAAFRCAFAPAAQSRSKCRRVQRHPPARAARLPRPAASERGAAPAAFAPGEGSATPACPTRLAKNPAKRFALRRSGSRCCADAPGLGRRIQGSPSARTARLRPRPPADMVRRQQRGEVQRRSARPSRLNEESRRSGHATQQPAAFRGAFASGDANRARGAAASSVIRPHAHCSSRGWRRKWVRRRSTPRRSRPPDRTTQRRAVAEKQPSNVPEKSVLNRDISGHFWPSARLAARP